MIRDWVHGMGHSPLCQILLQILCKALITASPPACTSSPGILSISGDFPFLSDFTAASTSSRKIGYLSVSVTCGTVNTSGSPTTVWLYSSAQYSVHPFRMSLVSVRQFPSLSCMVMVFPCFVLVRVLTSWYAFLVSFFLMWSSMSWHCASIQDSFAFFLLFLISWLIALYFLSPSVASCLPFFSALRSSHRSSMLVVTHGLLTALRLPKISPADSVNSAH